ncbi:MULTISPECIES: GntR family transcriptional regulator [unclassified Pseudomonas]|uniref:GntR family transcriptional regulator n=1 Tax=unclassified Pseudomonas TaxID=196821 RepID=UPI00244CDB7A|nr:MULTISPECIES: GntR family transcriptional regulator [unclassified Pseudomonas]MDG9923357.1 GntR family transcriptional regulator [Pseudomonas sp. GD04045]MDH0037542.1 GntR family transcriptional regulator [Pseudomonas sp. GD04019]
MADNLQETLYQRIRESLLEGRFQPGERLKIRDLAAQWGTSPMPVRAALQRLVAEGALEGEPQRSVRVPLMTRERYQNIFQVRLGLEGLAVELATPHLSPADMAELRDCVQRMDLAIEQRQVQDYLEANSRFHLRLYGACGNPILLRSIESLWLQIGPFFNRLFTGADLSLRLNDFHEEAFAAIEAGDAKAARKAMEQDLIYFARFLLNLLELEGAQPRSR